MPSVAERIHDECGELTDQRLLLTLRLMAAESDPDLRSDDPATLHRSTNNAAQLARIVHSEWRGRKGPRFNRIYEWVKYSLIANLTDAEVADLHQDALYLLGQAIPPNGNGARD